MCLRDTSTLWYCRASAIASSLLENDFFLEAAAAAATAADEEEEDDDDACSLPRDPTAPCTCIDGDADVTPDPRRRADFSAAAIILGELMRRWPLEKSAILLLVLVLVLSAMPPG